MDAKDRALNADYVERVSDPEKPGQTYEEVVKRDVDSDEVDYSGAVKKRDPAEDALVRKLDWYIIPTYASHPNVG